MIILEGYLMVLVSAYLQYDETNTKRDEEASEFFISVMIIFTLIITPITFAYLVT